LLGGRLSTAGLLLSSDGHGHEYDMNGTLEQMGGYCLFVLGLGRYYCITYSTRAQHLAMGLQEKGFRHLHFHLAIGYICTCHMAYIVLSCSGQGRRKREGTHGMKTA
jgi:hypothetical protein